MNTSDSAGFLDTKIDGVTIKSVTNKLKVDKTGLGINNVDNTSDADKPVSSATQTALNLKSNVLDIIDNLTSSDTDKPASANQVKILKGLIDSINTLLISDNTNLDSIQEVVDYIETNRSTLDALGISNITGLQNALDNKVDKISGKSLSTNDYTNTEKTKVSNAITKTGANEISTLTEKVTPHNNDLFILEDFENAGVKKKVKRSALVGGGGLGL
jgi:hypothetical protein